MFWPIFVVFNLGCVRRGFPGWQPSSADVEAAESHQDAEAEPPTAVAAYQGQLDKDEMAEAFKPVPLSRAEKRVNKKWKPPEKGGAEQWLREKEDQLLRNMAIKCRMLDIVPRAAVGDEWENVRTDDGAKEVNVLV